MCGAGKDSATFDDLNRLTANHFDEAQLFRLDHYLGKEVILNIATLRWANQLFEPTWNARHIESVQRPHIAHSHTPCTFHAVHC